MTITVNKLPIESFTFNGGECHVSIADIAITEITAVVAYLYSSDDIMQLMMTVDAIRRKNSQTTIDLVIPYFPYGRQDRVCNQGEALSVVVMAKMINSLECASVTIYDPHSAMTENALDNCTVVNQAEILSTSGVITAINTKGLTLLSPDAGAKAKTQQIAEENNIDAIYCTKTREVKTGKITATRIPDGVKGKDFIIVDDICDGGRTFIELAKSLKKAGAGDLYLYVTHGIFSKGLDQLSQYFEHIYCYHSFLNQDQVDSNYLTIIEGV